jgi:VanZ family protein
LHKSIRWREILSKYEEVNNDVAVSECGNDVISSVIRRRMRERGVFRYFLLGTIWFGLEREIISSLR